MRQWYRTPALKDHLFHRTFQILSPNFTPLADTWPFLLVSARHICLRSDLLHVAETDHKDKLLYTPLIKSLLVEEAASKLGNTVQLTYLCRGHVWAGWSAPGPLQAAPGDPLHPITAGERLVGRWWAAGCVTLVVTTCDLGAVWQAVASPRGPGGGGGGGSMGIGGNELVRAPPPTGRHWTTRKAGTARYARLS